MDIWALIASRKQPCHEHRRAVRALGNTMNNTSIFNAASGCEQQTKKNYALTKFSANRGWRESVDFQLANIYYVFYFSLAIVAEARRRVLAHINSSELKILKFGVCLCGRGGANIPYQAHTWIVVLRLVTFSASTIRSFCLIFRYRSFLG